MKQSKGGWIVTLLTSKIICWPIGKDIKDLFNWSVRGIGNLTQEGKTGRSPLIPQVEVPPLPLSCVRLLSNLQEQI